MSTHLQDRIEKIEQIITKLGAESAKGKLVVVEGKKDVRALQELGINGPFLMLKTGGKSFLDVIQIVEEQKILEVILFLDFDRRGKEGTRHLLQSLERLKVKVNVKLWRELDALIGREVKCIESLPSYLNTIKQKIQP